MGDDTWSGPTLPWALAKVVKVPKNSPLASGLQVRMIVVGEPGKCAAPLVWFSENMGTFGNWTWEVGQQCAGPEISRHIFTCPACQFTQTSSLVATFHFSCQAYYIEAAAVPTVPVGSCTKRVADPTLTKATPTARIKNITWSLHPILSTLQDNTTWGRGAQWWGCVFTPPPFFFPPPPHATFLPLRCCLSRPSTPPPLSRARFPPLFPTPRSYDLTSQELEVVPATSSLSVTPGKDVVTVRVNVLLLPFVGSNSFTMISNAATLLANLVGILGVLGGFASAFALVEKNKCKFASPQTLRSQRYHQLCTSAIFTGRARVSGEVALLIPLTATSFPARPLLPLPPLSLLQQGL
jgi:hypothetical protein